MAPCRSCGCGEFGVSVEQAWINQDSWSTRKRQGSGKGHDPAEASEISKRKHGSRLRRGGDRQRRGVALLLLRVWRRCAYSKCQQVVRTELKSSIRLLFLSPASAALRSGLCLDAIFTPSPSAERSPP